MKWSSIVFGELYLQSSRNGIYKSKEYHGTGCKIINMGELFAFPVIRDQDMKRVELSLEEKERFLVAHGDLLFARRSLVEEGAGKCTLIESPNEDTTFESSIIRVRLDPKLADPRFYFYYFNSPLGRATVGSIVTGVNVKGIRGSELRLIHVPNISLDEQQRISLYVRRYDDLIENNLRRIALLEEAAQQLYKEWFVRLQFPGHDDLNVVDGIPEGWTKGTVRDLVEIKSGYAFKSKSFTDSGLFRVVTIRHVKDGEFDANSDSRIDEIPREMPVHCSLSVGDVLLSLTGNIGRACLVTGSNCLLNQRVAKLIPKRGLGFVYSFFRNETTKVRLETIATGVAQQNLSPIKMGHLDAVIPSTNVLHAFEAITEPICRKVILLHQQNQRLIEARELLLPRLISGEIEV
ncbi:restriction modification system DNA specificity subunit [Rhodopirellula maiorica SM1]|uniref:Restriction modification system DNA specificity subunit n=1 Tax=Rhodopirellula maiorica SM1 TaxID=1265738 RepID=M5RLG3_9BACT|nr:restriction endonuclease subunit S [Rhodopirellula maiorica]EMI20155.1 restriction modification system DNA specificity subunit [Rhodopirellula maiorica SM1]